MPTNTFKNSKISQLQTLYKIYGPWWTIKLTILAIYRYLYFVLIRQSYSQYQEDLQISKLLNNKPKIFYIDIGSNHPTKFNNTYRFYKSGSAGIVVEPNQNLTDLHQHIRPNDICLNIGASNTKSIMNFYELFPHVASTFSDTEYKYQLKMGAKLVKVSQIRTDTLANIINQYATSITIDLLSVDTEGHDLEVLQSNNWHKYRPKLICVETLKDSGVHNYLTDHNYQRVFQNSINSIYETM